MNGIGCGIHQRNAGFVNPNSYSPAFWYDFGDINTVLDDGGIPVEIGATIYDVTDKSGNGRTQRQATVASQPLYANSSVDSVYATPSGRACAVLDGTDDFMASVATYTMPAAGTWFFVAWWDNLTDHTALVPDKQRYLGGRGAGDGGNSPGTSIHIQTTPRWYVNTNNSGTASEAEFEVAPSSDGRIPVIGCGWFDGTNARMYLNGTSAGQTASPSVASSGALTHYIGRQRANNNNTWKGIINTMILYERVLTLTERNNVQSYLADLTGITAAAQSV